MNGENMMLKEVRQKRPQCLRFHLYEVCRTGKFTETRMQINGCQCLREVGEWRVTVNGDLVFSRGKGDKNVLERDNGDGCTTLSMY